MSVRITSDSPFLHLRVCAKDCREDCVDYKTPVEVCYNPLRLFAGDPQWGPYDIRDQILDSKTFRRTFYLSGDGSCTGEAEVTDVPLDTKLGPLGLPRSCGVFFR
jgi:hypothetical protein